MDQKLSINLQKDKSEGTQYQSGISHLWMSPWIFIPIHKYSNMRKVMKKYIKCFQSQISVYKYEVLKSQSDERAKNFQFCIVNNYFFHYQIFRQLLYYSSKYTFFARVGQKQILYRAKSTSTRFWFCLQKSKRNFPPWGQLCPLLSDRWSFLFYQ